MDSAVRIPGTNIRFGLDPIIGLVPVAGDVLSAAFSIYILTEAGRIGVPRPVLTRMAANIGLDLVIGLLPVVGDVGDFVYKANERNLRLLNLHLSGPQPGASASR